jgi:hypothetical protein
LRVWASGVDRGGLHTYPASVSTSDMIAEKARQLPEFQALVVLAFIDELSSVPVPDAVELMRLPPAERRRVLSIQARQAEATYRQDPDLIAEDADAPVNHD